MNLRRKSKSQGGFKRMHGAHLIGHRANPANAGCDIRDFLKIATAKEGFEEPRRLEYVQLHFAQFPALGPDVNPALAFNTGQIINLDCLLTIRVFTRHGA
jgi:hypothetical protein